ncbi:hypothetical protein PRIPAC_77198 [Pristionchus pacificus]|uniref:G protein-coupled receptor n=1 Tax=Pristionchus pacificus TaxID=54126 RepID=A0A2A6CLT0_PRIPA|nr:hypothetical protein PRIPAC_77198 [Pristionchus pacificus]|eukprot:PDM79164.1 G protein-coupled receptor [Pristionchus pacificus]
MLAAVPIIFVYLPFLLCINTAFLKIPVSVFHDLCSPAFTFFPVWDPAVVILLFTDYRRGLMGIVRKPPKPGPSTLQMTTIFVKSRYVASTADRRTCVECSATLCNNAVLSPYFRHLQASANHFRVIRYIFGDVVHPVDGTYKLKTIIPQCREFCGQRVTSFWVGCQSLPFTLLGIHFLYRYWSVRKPNLIPLFANVKFVSFLLCITLGGLISWYFLCFLATSGHDNSVALATMVAEYERKYGKRIENGWILMDQWRDDEYDWILITITLLMNIIMISSLSFSCVFAVRTFLHIRHSYKISAQADQLQRKLLIALCAQAAVPIIFVYLPFLLCTNTAFLKIPVSVFHDLCSPAFTFFPVWDPAVVILLFTDYRRGLMGIVRKPPKPGPSTLQMTTIFVKSRFVASTAEGTTIIQ